MPDDLQDFLSSHLVAPCDRGHPESKRLGITVLSCRRILHSAKAG